MTLQKKLALSLIGGLVVVIPLAQFFQWEHSRSLTAQLAKATGQLLQERELKNVENFHSGVNLMVVDSLARGDMDVFSKILELQKSVPGFVEFSLYNNKGVVTYSSDKSALKRAIDPAIQSHLETNPTIFIRTNRDEFEIFEPQIATKKCMECHDDFTVGKICGVTHFRFSNDSARQLDAQIAAASTTTTRQSLQDALMAFVLELLVLGGVILWGTQSVARAIKAVAHRLHDSSNHMELASQQVASSSQTVADGASNQAASLEETSSSLEEMTSMTRQTATHAQSANTLARQAREAAGLGVKEMGEMTQSMEEIKDASADISKIIQTIEGIAFNTNILALNAAVEAARVGEAGQGFAVVADEVRSLAQRCKDSARETEERIQSAIIKTGNGVVITRKVAARLQEIEDKIRQVDGLVSELTQANNEQSRGVTEVSSAVSHIDQVTQSNAASAEEGAGAAEELSQQARALNHAIDELLAMVGETIDGKSTATASSDEPPSLAPQKPAPANRPALQGARRELTNSRR